MLHWRSAFLPASPSLSLLLFPPASSWLSSSSFNIHFFFAVTVLSLFFQPYWPNFDRSPGPPVFARVPNLDYPFQFIASTASFHGFFKRKKNSFQELHFLRIRECADWSRSVFCFRIFLTFEACSKFKLANAQDPLFRLSRLTRNHYDKLKFKLSKRNVQMKFMKFYDAKLFLHSVKRCIFCQVLYWNCSKDFDFFSSPSVGFR